MGPYGSSCGPFLLSLTGQVEESRPFILLPRVPAASRRPQEFGSFPPCDAQRSHLDKPELAACEPENAITLGLHCKMHSILDEERGH